MTSSSPGRRSERSASEEVLRRVLPESPTGDEDPHPPAPPAGVDARRQALLDAVGSPDRESW